MLEATNVEANEATSGIQGGTVTYTLNDTNLFDPAGVPSVRHVTTAVVKFKKEFKDVPSIISLGISGFTTLNTDHARLRVKVLQKLKEGFNIEIETAALSRVEMVKVDWVAIP